MFRFREIELTNFRCFRHLSVPLDDALTVFVAENGCGKTTALDAIRYLLWLVLARFPQVTTQRPLREDIRQAWLDRGRLFPPRQVEDAIVPLTAPYLRLRGRAACGWLSQPGEVAWDFTLRRDGATMPEEKGLGIAALGEATRPLLELAAEGRFPDGGFPVFAAFGTSRAVIRQVPKSRRGFRKVFSRWEAYRGALEGGLDYRRLVEWVAWLDGEALQTMRARRDFDYRSLEQRTIDVALSRMLPEFFDLRPKLRPLRLEITRQLGEGALAQTLRVDSQLSDGFKCMLTLMLSVVSRILEANHGWPEATPERLLAVGGVVVIDEVELHLHPSWQRRALGDLRRTFPNIQFIVSTHSPQIVASVRPEQLRVLRQGEPGEVTLSSEVCLPVDACDANSVLARIFDVDLWPPGGDLTERLNRFAALTMDYGRLDPEDRAEWETLREALLGAYGADFAPLRALLDYHARQEDAVGGGHAEA